jgi:ABC-type oligopeptide transport system substrate-binding subunit
VDCPSRQDSTPEPYSGWKQLFGGQYGILPKHILDGKDITTEMSNGYKWSGGPWIIDHWTKGVEVVLVPNTKFWGTKPKLDKVTFKVQADTAAEFESFKNNEVSMIYPQPQLDVVDQLKAGLPDSKSSVNANTGNLEALWINNASAPMDDIAVHQALGYAVDHAAIVSSCSVTQRRDRCRPCSPRCARDRRTAARNEGPGQGRLAHDRCRLRQGWRRHLGQGWDSGLAHDQDHGGQRPA